MNSVNKLTPVILAGGHGTRLRAAVSDRPKVLAPVGGRPFVAYLLDFLQREGFQRVVLSIGYMADAVRQTLGERFGELELDYVIEQTPLGTGGALRMVYDKIGDQSVVVLNGDSYCDLDFTAYRNWFPDDAIAGLALTYATDSGRYGAVEFEADGLVTAFHEKQGAIGAGWINAGVYLLTPKVLSQIPAGIPVSLEHEIFKTLIGNRLFAWPGGRDFIDIGLPETYRAAELFFSKDRSEWA